MTTLPAPLDRSSRVPIWQQLAGRLRDRLLRGEFADRFPTDHELVTAYGVSRHTAREAVRALRDEGLLERHRGRGTFLRPTRFEQPLGRVYTLAGTVTGHGGKVRTVVLTVDTRTDAAAAARLDQPTSAALVYVERLRCADGEPLAVDRSWLPCTLAHRLLDADLTDASLYDVLGERCRLTIDHISERIRPVVPSRPVRTMLDLRPDVAVFSVERIASMGGVPVEWRHTILRGDRFAYAAEGGATDDLTRSG